MQVDLNGHVFLCGHAPLHQLEQSYISVVHILIKGHQIHQFEYLGPLSIPPTC